MIALNYISFSMLLIIISVRLENSIVNTSGNEIVQIIGGHDAKREDVPYAVAVNICTRNWFFWCGNWENEGSGVIINNRYVIKLYAEQ